MLLLGQSFLSNFKLWSIDNSRQVLVLTANSADVTAPPAAALAVALANDNAPMDLGTPLTEGNGLN